MRPCDFMAISHVWNVSEPTSTRMHRGYERCQQPVDRRRTHRRQLGAYPGLKRERARPKAPELMGASILAKVVPMTAARYFPHGLVPAA